MKVILAHGFNVSDGGVKSTDKLIPYLKRMGFDVVECDYGYTFLHSVRGVSKTTAKVIASMTRTEPEPFIGIGHSNGCNILDKAADYGADFTRLVYISPALNRGTKLAEQVERCDVLHTAHDFWTKAATFIPFSRWGRMGARGYKGKDVRYYNHDFSENIRGHSDWFHEGKIQFTAHILRGILVGNDS